MDLPICLGGSKLPRWLLESTSVWSQLDPQGSWDHTVSKEYAGSPGGSCRYFRVVPVRPTGVLGPYGVKQSIPAGPGSAFCAAGRWRYTNRHPLM